MGRASSDIRVLLPVLGVAAAVACGRIDDRELLAGAGAGGADSGSDAEAGGLGAACGIISMHAPDDCVACAESLCCDQMLGCAADLDCVALRKCGGQPGCSSGACWESCKAQYGPGLPEQAVFTACLEHDCAGPCLLTPSCGLVFQSAQCTSCAEAHCCVELYAAASTVDYHAWAECSVGCSTTFGCQSQCNDAHPEGAAAAQAYYACLGSSCMEQCSS